MTRGPDSVTVEGLTVRHREIGTAQIVTVQRRSRRSFCCKGGAGGVFVAKKEQEEFLFTVTVFKLQS